VTAKRPAPRSPEAVLRAHALKQRLGAAHAVCRALPAFKRGRASP
jgi:hypothetical protein